MTRTINAAIGAALLTMALQAPASAQEHSWGLTGRIWGGAAGRYVLNDNESFASPGFGTIGLEVSGSAPAFGADLELRFDRWIGLDAAIGYTDMTVDFTTTTAPGTESTQRFAVVPLMLALNLHLIHARAIDIWAGPQVGYVMFPNNLTYMSSAGTFTYTPENVFSAKGFVVGSDIRLGRALALNLAVRWQDADGDSNSHLTVDPTFVTIGLTRRF